jgi:hypothetical protein
MELRPNPKDLEGVNSNTEIKGLKIVLNCRIHNHVWAIWFRGEEDLHNNLKADWDKCSLCRLEAEARRG